jgi:hypothetical protein
VDLPVETWQATGVTTTGCGDNRMSLTTSLDGLTPGSPVTGRVVVRSGGRVYENSAGEYDKNTSGPTPLEDLFNYGPVSKPGTWPIPADQPLRVELSIEHPLGTTVSSWTLSLDSCNNGKILYNGPTEADQDGDNVPASDDQCPTVDGTGFANGCPLYDRALTISYHKSRFQGRLGTTDPGRALRADTPVSVWQVRNGSDKLVGKDVNSPKGNYELARHAKAGRYYATTPALLVPNVGASLKETSDTVRIHGH